MMKNRFGYEGPFVATYTCPDCGDELHGPRDSEIEAYNYLFNLTGSIHRKVGYHTGCNRPNWFVEICKESLETTEKA